MDNIFVQSNDEIFSELQSSINEYYLEQLQLIEDDVKEIFHNAIKTNVYDYYKPNWYIRTYALLNSVDTEFIETNGITTLHVFVNTKALPYYSVYDKSLKVSNVVPFWIEKGHNARNYLPTNSKREQFYNEFHAYEARNYLEEAFQKIKSKYGSEDLIIEIDEDSFNEDNW